MELATLLILAAAMAAMGVLLAVASVVAIVIFTGWIVRLFSRRR